MQALRIFVSGIALLTAVSFGHIRALALTCNLVAFSSLMLISLQELDSRAFAQSESDDEDDDDERVVNDDSEACAEDQLRFNHATGVSLDEFEFDDIGYPTRKNEILAFDPGTDELATAQYPGFELIERPELSTLGGQIDRIPLPSDFTRPDAVDALQNALPAAAFDCNYLYVMPEGAGAEN